MLGVSRNTVYQYFSSDNLSRETVTNIITTFKTNEQDAFGIKESTTPNPRLEAYPLHLASDPHDYNSTGNRFEDLGDGTLRMRVPVIPYKAYAGYLRGFQDPEFYEDLKTISVDVYKEHSGHYVAFEVAGDSMMTTDPSLFEYMALPGWKAVGRDLLRHHWKYKLHTHNTDTWIIVHNDEGILIKQIINHDVEQGNITIHSLNPAYEDEVLHLNDVAQIFSVVKYIIDK
jgi:phage repressor protein C with HTH and peptisase S24 domain